MNYHLSKSLDADFGEEKVNIARRELIIQTGRPPTWLEMITKLCIEEGWTTPPPKQNNQPPREVGE